jgi:Rhodopirellula transposase DDE domain
MDAVIRLATTMTWQGKCPVVALVTTTYQIGVKLTKDAMQMVETPLQRLPELDTWFVDIVPTSSHISAPSFFEIPYIRWHVDIFSVLASLL